jgi:hypothetical protein
MDKRGREKHIQWKDVPREKLNGFYLFHYNILLNQSLLVIYFCDWRDVNSDAGLIPRVCQHLFEELENIDSEYSVQISYVELYNEKLRDLLSPHYSELKLLNDSKVYILFFLFIIINNILYFFIFYNKSIYRFFIIYTYNFL